LFCGGFRELVTETRLVGRSGRDVGHNSFSSSVIEHTSSGDFLRRANVFAIEPLQWPARSTAQQSFAVQPSLFF
jgi:hypothetical protein